jgi:hypothetical protein
MNKTDQLVIKNVLYGKGLYDDIINIIIEYAKLTLKEQCLDPKSLKRCRKHKDWLERYSKYTELIKGEIIFREKIREIDDRISYLEEFKFSREITKEPSLDGYVYTIYAPKKEFIHPITKEVCYNKQKYIDDFKKYYYEELNKLEYKVRVNNNYNKCALNSRYSLK